MDWSLIIFLVIVAYFTFSGYRSGFFSVLSRIISIPAAYLITLFFTQDFGQWLQGVSPLKGMFAYIAGGSILFFGSALILSSIFALLKKFIVNPEQQDNQALAITGGILGLVVGIVVGMATVWFSGTITSVIASKVGKTTEEPSAFTQKVNDMAGNAIGGVVSSLGDSDTLSQVATSVIANPAEQIKRVNNLANRGYFQEIIYSNKARQALDSRNAADLWETPAFQKLVKDQDFRQLAETMNLAKEGEDLEKQMAIKVTEVWAKIDSLKTDPRFRELAQDPEVQQLIQSRNIFRVMNSEKIEELLHIIGSVETPEIKFEPSKDFQEKKVEVHRWVDEKGRVHYSDKKQGDN